MLKKVISGGQWGVDRIGLVCAMVNGIETGGTAPKGYKTEKGPEYSLKTKFGLLEDNSYNYNDRTEKNVINSDGTVLFGDMSSPGSRRTIAYLELNEKPHIINPSSDGLISFINENNIEILNVAGNRESKLNLDQIRQFAAILNNTFKHFNEMKNENN